MDLLRKRAVDEIEHLMLEESERVKDNVETVFTQLDGAISVDIGWDGFWFEKECSEKWIPTPYETTCKYLVAKVDHYNYMLICCSPNEKPNKAFDLLHRVGQSNVYSDEIYGSGDSIEDKLYKSEFPDSDGVLNEEILFKNTLPTLSLSYEKNKYKYSISKIPDTVPMIINDPGLDDEYELRYDNTCCRLWNNAIEDPREYGGVAFKLSGSAPCMICIGDLTEKEQGTIEKCWENTRTISRLIDAIKKQNVFQKIGTQQLIKNLLNSSSDTIICLLAKMSIREGKKQIRTNKLKIIQAKKELEELYSKQEKLKTVNKKQIRHNSAQYAYMDEQYNYQLKASKNDIKESINEKNAHINKLEKNIACEARENPKVLQLLQKNMVLGLNMELDEIEQLSDVYSECKDLPEC